MTGFRQFPNSLDLIPVIYRDNPYICLDVESFPLDSAENTSGFDDDNISEVHISSIEGRKRLKVSFDDPIESKTVPRKKYT
ncbi:Hypothetical predicted protein [Mytilus galloprovincialis]|uniref:Uncharacterized protein n=1 Tax=Mytilus galloprovincialis TaxID=29158 RepID=A0A8B6GV08_MYTGA|nr:Hypothetical predicted protein [Mytilus galloprovincialis]